MIFVACDKTEYNPNSKDTYLKQLAAPKNITIGTLYNYSYSHSGYKDYEIYNKVISEEFDIYALEWEFAPNELWTSEYEYDFNYLDKALKFAQDNNLKVRGTHLLWYAQTPEWLENGNYTALQVKAMLKAYINTLFTHVKTEYPGVLTEISVANEILTDDETEGEYGFLRECVWVEKLGEYYIDSAFIWVNEVYPEGKLILNEYGNEFKGDFKTQKFLELATRLKDAGIPIDAVGLQCHFTTDKQELVDVPFDQTKFDQAIADYQNLGLEILITELDVRLNDDKKGNTDEKLEEQAEVYRQIFETCLKYSLVTNITMWGFNDDLSYLNGRASWLPQKRDWGLIFDANYNPKPAYFAITDVLK
ncbi:MAG: endo-1,4-beta-xylanase [Bacteroidales bacterium]|nr:endo-1,4-beta-xylanase [Bacteroidales bacterium]